MGGWVGGRRLSKTEFRSWLAARSSTKWPAGVGWAVGWQGFDVAFWFQGVHYLIDVHLHPGAE